VQGLFPKRFRNTSLIILLSDGPDAFDGIASMTAIFEINRVEEDCSEKMNTWIARINGEPGKFSFL
jgi:hypothetical protein